MAKLNRNELSKLLRGQVDLAHSAFQTSFRIITMLPVEQVHSLLQILKINYQIEN